MSATTRSPPAIAAAPTGRASTCACPGCAAWKSSRPAVRRHRVAVAAALARCGDLVSAPRNGWIPHLTFREYQVLNEAYDGNDKLSTAAHLNLDENTVRRALSSAIAKLGADTLPEALEIAERARLVR